MEFRKKKCPFLTRDIKEIKFSKDHPRLVYYRTTFNGDWTSADIVGKPLMLNNVGEFELPKLSYEGIN